MHELHNSYPRKRPNPERIEDSDLRSVHFHKKRKYNPPAEDQFPYCFWQNLSEVHLTRRALQELDRRNTVESTRSPPKQRARLRRRIHRQNNASFKPDHRSLLPVEQYLSCCSAEDLKTLTRTSRQGGPELSDLRGIPAPRHHSSQEMSSQDSSRGVKRSSLSSSNKASTCATTTQTRSTGPYNRNFQQNLVDGAIYPHGYRCSTGQALSRPENWEHINRVLAQPRASLSPSRFSDRDHEKFVQADADAYKEKQVTTSVIPVIEGKIEDAKCVAGGIPFTNLEHLTDGTLVPGNPDIYYGARPEQLDRRVRDELSNHIIPSTQDDLPIAPNFFLAAKGPDGSLAVANRQASYDGALGARGMYSLQCYGQSGPVYDNKAYTVSSIYHGGQLKMFTSHPHVPSTSGSRPEFRMHQLRSYAMADTAETFRKGAAAYRNLRDWAREHRDEAIRAANTKARQSHHRVYELISSTVETCQGESTDSSQQSQYLQNESSVTITELEANSDSSKHLATENISKRLRVESTATATPETTHGSHDASESGSTSIPATGLSQQLGNQVLTAQDPNQLDNSDFQPLRELTSTRLIKHMRKKGKNKR